MLRFAVVDRDARDGGRALDREHLAVHRELLVGTLALALPELPERLEYPAEHWIHHLRTTNPIESTFAIVRLRTKVTKGPGTCAAGIAMVYKLIDAAQIRWRAVHAPHLVALVRAGATFHKGKLLERPSTSHLTEPSGSTETEVA